MMKETALSRLTNTLPKTTIRNAQRENLNKKSKQGCYFFFEIALRKIISKLRPGTSLRNLKTNYGYACSYRIFSMPDNLEETSLTRYNFVFKVKFRIETLPHIRKIVKIYR